MDITSQLEFPELARNRVGSTEFDLEWILRALNENDEAWKKILNYRVISKMQTEDISALEGIVSRIYKITFNFENLLHKPYYAVLKVPDTEKVTETMRRANGDSHAVGEFVQNVIFAHNRERNFYVVHANAGIPVPKVFATQELIFGKQQGAILMEYIADKARDVRLYETLDLHKILNVVQHLSRFHAYSLSLDEKIIEQYNLPGMVMHSMWKSVAKMSQTTLETEVVLKDAFKPLEHLFKVDFLEYAFHWFHKDIGMRSVLVHGDMWGSNIFWQKREDGSLSDEVYAFLDWQALHAGNVGEDLARVIAFGVDADIRREAELFIFDIYFNVLQEEAQRRGANISFTKEEVRSCYRRAFICQSIIALGCTQFMLGPSHSTPSEAKIWQARRGKFLMRLKFALEDSVEILRTDLPDWFDKRFNHLL